MNEQTSESGGVEIISIRDVAGAVIDNGPAPRTDSWENLIFGMGGVRDPSSHTRFRMGGRLDDQEIEGVLAQSDFGAKGIESLPRHAMRPGWDLAITDGDPKVVATQRDAYEMEERRLLARDRMTEGSVWGRGFGGATTWMGIDDGREQWQPLDEKAIRSVEFLRTYSRQYVFIAGYYQDPNSPKFGLPELYRIMRMPLPALTVSGASSYAPQMGSVMPQALRGNDSPLALVHESRLVRWPGQPTTYQRRLFLQGWDDSVLERAWDALKQLGEDFAGKSLLLGRLAQAVYYIKKLYEMGAGKEADALRARMSQIDLSRSRSRSLMLDADREKFENVATPMGGMPELMDRAIYRLAGAFNMPVSKLIEIATGGNAQATEADQDRWDEEAESWRNDVLFPDRHERIARAIMLAKEGPFKGKLPEHWRITYRALRTLRPAAKATVRLTNAQSAAIWIDKGVVPPEAFALAQFTGEGDHEPRLDRQELDAALTRRSELAKRPPKDNAELGTVGARDAALGELQKAYFNGELPEDAALARLELVFQFSPLDAKRLLTMPAGWKPTSPAPKTVPGPDPQPPKGTGAGAPQGLPGFNAGGDPIGSKDTTKP